HMRPQKGPRITLIFTDSRRLLERKISVNLRNLWTMILNLWTLVFSLKKTIKTTIIGAAWAPAFTFVERN
ncbi:MAG: hypothetical protein LBG10_05860, partial [Treponema sp.]|nr:hypothetical protein [Treponema sp.]